MTPDMLARAGALLYGSRWATDLASALDIDRRTVLRWHSGSYPIPRHRVEQVRALLAQRARGITVFLGEIQDAEAPDAGIHPHA